MSALYCGFSLLYQALQPIHRHRLFRTTQISQVHYVPNISYVRSKPYLPFSINNTSKRHDMMRYECYRFARTSWELSLQPTCLILHPSSQGQPICANLAQQPHVTPTQGCKRESHWYPGYLACPDTLMPGYWPSHWNRNTVSLFCEPTAEHTIEVDFGSLKDVGTDNSFHIVVVMGEEAVVSKCKTWRHCTVGYKNLGGQWKQRADLIPFRDILQCFQDHCISESSRKLAR